MQQGKHGLTSDHIVNLNVVLADGSAVQVNEKSHPDLWWAFRGAGHNFGIVTSFESKVWPDNFKRYFVRTYQYLSSSHDAVFDAVNKFQGNGTLDPIWLASFGLYTMTNLSKTEVGSGFLSPSTAPKPSTMALISLTDTTRLPSSGPSSTMAPRQTLPWKR